MWEGRRSLITPQGAHRFEVLDTDNRRSDDSPPGRQGGYLQPAPKLACARYSWRAGAGALAAEELAGFDLKTVVGLTCLVGIVHEAKGDKVYANLSSVMKLPRAIPAPAGEIEPVAFDMAAPDWQVFAGLSSRLQAQIAESPEFIALPQQTQDHCPWGKSALSARQPSASGYADGSTSASPGHARAARLRDRAGAERRHGRRRALSWRTRMNLYLDIESIPSRRCAGAGARHHQAPGHRSRASPPGLGEADGAAQDAWRKQSLDGGTGQDRQRGRDRWRWPRVGALPCRG